MTVGRRIKRSRLLISTGIQLIIVCLVIILIGSFFEMKWLIETSSIVAILVAIFTLFEYWHVKRLKKR